MHNMKTMSERSPINWLGNNGKKTLHKKVSGGLLLNVFQKNKYKLKRK